MSASPRPLAFHEVDAQRWDDLYHLFQAPGGPKSCWCMIWRGTGEEARKRAGPSRRAAMLRRVEAGIPVGILGYLSAEPAAWCSIAPRDTYKHSLGGLRDPREDETKVWSIVCFYVPRRIRGRGLGSAMLAAAVDLARSKGATAVEAYPVGPDSPSYRFMGLVSMFERAGFREMGRAGSRRHVMRLAL